MKPMKTTLSESFETLLVDFAQYLTGIIDNENSRKSYISYVRTLHRVNNGCTMDWLGEAVVAEQPIKFLSSRFDEYFENVPDVQPQSQWKTGLCRLGEFVCGFTDSSTNLHSIKNFDSLACELIAQSAIFCSKEVFDKVKAGELGSKENLGVGNEFGAWYHYTLQRARHDEKRREYKDAVVRFDDNTYANTAIKTAVLKGLSHYGIHGGSKQLFRGFEVCHIWPETCYDARYHTSVGNLVLLPREIAGLTDHCMAVEELLKYEAWKRFGFKPAEAEVPAKPKNYNKITWKN